jgi:septum formation protein
MAAGGNEKEFSLVLGSSSKWRKNILASFLGPSFPFTTLSPDIDEKAIRHPDPRKMTLAIAKAKAEALKTKLNDTNVSSHPTFLICSDQVIIYHGEVREKPENEEEARAFLRSYKEAPAKAVVAVVVYNTKTGLFFEGIATATQHFQELPESFIDQLIAQGDVMWCAGGFTVEEMTPYLGY